jgi:hypothetical protein
MWEAKGKPVDLCFHGEARLSERGVPEHLAIETIDKPDTHWTRWVTTPKPALRHIAEKAFRDRILRVVYEEDDVEIILVTAFWRR